MSVGRVASRIIAGTVLLLALAGAAAEIGGTYTSIRREDCGMPSAAIRTAFKRQDLGVQECPAPEDWRLLFVSSDANSWLELRRNGVIWSAEEAVVYEDPIGLFPNVGGSRVVEWRRDAQGRLTAFVFRVVAQDRDDPGRQVSRLFVVRLGPPGPCLIGRVATNEAARALADGPAVCPDSRPDAQLPRRSERRGSGTIHCLAVPTKVANTLIPPLPKAITS